MTNEVQNLTIDRVRKGQKLPELLYDCSATTVVLGALAARDCRPMHHDSDFARNRNGVKDIFLNTPNLSHWFERYVTDWTGPKGRLGRVKFFMRDSVFAGSHMILQGEVKNVETDAVGCAWVDIAVDISVEGEVKTGGSVRIAIPTDAEDNPWVREGDQWQP